MSTADLHRGFNGEQRQAPTHHQWAAAHMTQHFGRDWSIRPASASHSEENTTLQASLVSSKHIVQCCRHLGCCTIPNILSTT
jgi:hypothetical protein